MKDDYLYLLHIQEELPTLLEIINTEMKNFS